MSVNVDFDVVVVGLGGVGSFALRALSKDESANSKRILGIEGSDLEHAGYSSRGKTRIYRRAYFEHPNYVPWIHHSVSVIQELEKSSGESLMNPCGTLLLEPAAVAVAVAEVCRDDIREKNVSNDDELIRATMPPMLRASLESAKRHHIPVEYLDSDQLKERFPQFHYPPQDRMVGLLEPEGGFLRPEKIMRAALREAQQSTNVTIWQQTKLIRFQQLKEQVGLATAHDSMNNSYVELHLLKMTDSGKEENIVIRTRKLLLAMGGWTSQVIPSWKSILHPIRQVQTWIDVSHTHAKHLYSSQNMPGFIYVSSQYSESSFYGLPGDDKDEHCAHWVKVAEHNLNLQHSTTAPSIRSSVVSEDDVNRIRSLIPLVLDKRAWNSDHDHESPNSTPMIVETRPCMYTVTPDHHFVIGTPLECCSVDHRDRNDSKCEHVFAIAGLSGHGYKMVAALGQMMADFAMDKNVEEIWKTEFCSPRRFGV